jgi:hypothetical protein
MKFVRKMLIVYSAFVSPKSEQDEEAAELLAERRKATVAAVALVLFVLGAGLYSVLFHTAGGDADGCGQPNCVAFVSS